MCSAPEFPGHIRNDLPADSLALSGFRSKSFFKKTFKATKAVVLCTHVLCLSESLGDHFWAFGSGVSGEELITATLRDGAGKLTHQGPGETGALSECSLFVALNPHWVPVWPPANHPGNLAL